MRVDHIYLYNLIEFTDLVLHPSPPCLTGAEGGVELTNQPMK